MILKDLMMILKRNTGANLKRKFLIINPFGIGDVLFTTPIVKAIKDKYPESFIGFWCNQRVSPLLTSNPNIDKVFALSRGDIKKIYNESILRGIYLAFKLFISLKKQKFDVVLDYSLDHRYGLISLFCGIKKRIGFDYKGRGRFLTDKQRLDSYESKHVVEYYLELLKPLNIEVNKTRLDLYIKDEERIKAKDLLTFRGIEDSDLLIGIAPGAGGSWGKDASIKHWPALKFAQLADKLAEKFKAKILILGDETERSIADIIVSAMRNKPIDLVGKVPLENLSAIIKCLNLLIANDGGTMHISCALGVKTIAIFGPVSEIVYGPYPNDCQDYKVIKKDLECRPCYKNFRVSVCDRDKECLRTISVDDVFEAVVKLLD